MSRNRSLYDLPTSCWAIFPDISGKTSMRMILKEIMAPGDVGEESGYASKEELS